MRETPPYTELDVTNGLSFTVWSDQRITVRWEASIHYAVIISAKSLASFLTVFGNCHNANFSSGMINRLEMTGNGRQVIFTYVRTYGPAKLPCSVIISREQAEKSVEQVRQLLG